MRCEAYFTANLKNNNLSEINVEMLFIPNINKCGNVTDAGNKIEMFTLNIV